MRKHNYEEKKVEQKCLLWIRLFAFGFHNGQSPERR